MALYHLTVSHGSRAGGQSAAAKAAYISREEKYVDRPGLVRSTSGNLPEWAESSAHFWQSVDVYSRANARLYTEVEFALPRELDQEQGWRLAEQMADAMALRPEGRVPYSLAIHDDGKGNPHVHLVLSSRVDDGQRRSREQFFAQAASRRTRADTVAGAPTWSRETDRDWLEGVRSRWAELANDALASARCEQRIDHRSYARRGIARVPTVHEGWAKQVKAVRQRVNNQARQANASLDQAAAATKAAKAEVQREAEQKRQAEVSKERFRQLDSMSVEERRAAYAKNAREMLAGKPAAPKVEPTPAQPARDVAPKPSLDLPLPPQISKREQGRALDDLPLPPSYKPSASLGGGVLERAMARNAAAEARNVAEGRTAPPQANQARSLADRLADAKEEAAERRREAEKNQSRGPRMR